MQAGLYLTATRGVAAPEARICHERRALVSFAQRSAASMYCPEGPVSLRPKCRKVERGVTDRGATLLARAKAE